MDNTLKKKVDTYAGGGSHLSKPAYSTRLILLLKWGKGKLSSQWLHQIGRLVQEETRIVPLSDDDFDTRVAPILNNWSNSQYHKLNAQTTYMGEKLGAWLAAVDDAAAGDAKQSLQAVLGGWDYMAKHLPGKAVKEGEEADDEELVRMCGQALAGLVMFNRGNIPSGLQRAACVQLHAAIRHGGLVPFLQTSVPLADSFCNNSGACMPFLC